MNPLVAPGVCRFTVNGTYAGRPIANVLDMWIDDTDPSATREECIEDQAHIIVSAWADHINPHLVNDYSANTVSWLDLNSLTGSTGVTAVGSGTDFPNTGDDTGNPAPANVSLRVQKNISPLRGQRQGRMYLVGMPESYTDAGAPNTVVADRVTAINAALDNFLGAINQESGVEVPVYDSDLVVLHTHIVKPDPNDKDTWSLVYDGRSTVQTLTLDATVATQRRRLR